MVRKVVFTVDQSKKVEKLGQCSWSGGGKILQTSIISGPVHALSLSLSGYGAWNIGRMTDMTGGKMDKLALRQRYYRALQPK